MSKLYVWSSFAQCGCGGGRLYIAAMSWASSGPGSNPKANMPAANCWTNHNEAEAFLSPAVTLPHDHGASVHSLLWSNGQKAHIAISFFFFAYWHVCNHCDVLYSTNGTGGSERIHLKDTGGGGGIESPAEHQSCQHWLAEKASGKGKNKYVYGSRMQQSIVKHWGLWSGICFMVWMCLF